jgi:hypothetical protein
MLVATYQVSAEVYARHARQTLARGIERPARLRGSHGESGQPLKQLNLHVLGNVPGY